MANKIFKIKCLVKNNINIYSYYFMIYDSNFSLIYSGYTDKLGYIYFKPEYYKTYHFVVRPSPRINPGLMHKCIVFTKNSCDTLLLEFNILENNLNPSVTLYILDANYENLKIEKGRIFLWPNHMKY